MSGASPIEISSSSSMLGSVYRARAMRQHLLLAPGQPARQLPAPLAEDGEAGVALLLEVGHLRGPTAVGVHEQVLGHRQVGEDGPTFGDGAHTRGGPDGPAAALADLLAVEPTPCPWWPASGRSPP